MRALLLFAAWLLWPRTVSPARTSARYIVSNAPGTSPRAWAKLSPSSTFERTCNKMRFVFGFCCCLARGI